MRSAAVSWAHKPHISDWHPMRTEDLAHLYTVGVDFGTLSGRAVVVRVSDGAEVGAAVYEYPE